MDFRWIINVSFHNPANTQFYRNSIVFLWFQTEMLWSLGRFFLFKGVFCWTSDFAFFSLGHEYHDFLTFLTTHGLFSSFLIRSRSFTWLRTILSMFHGANWSSTPPSCATAPGPQGPRAPGHGEDQLGRSTPFAAQIGGQAWCGDLEFPGGALNLWKAMMNR